MQCTALAYNKASPTVQSEPEQNTVAVNLFDEFPEFPDSSKEHYIIYTEGYRRNRTEIAMFDTKGDDDSQYIVWSSGRKIELQNNSNYTNGSKWYLNQNEWIHFEDNYPRISDKSYKIIASDLDMYDTDGNLILKGLGYSGTEDSAEHIAEQIIGTWGNQAAVSNDALTSYSSAYETIFSTDGRVVQYGYRNRDVGTYQIVNHTVLATFDYNMYDTPGYGFRQIEGYTYTVSYTYDEDDDTLYADYATSFEDAANSNADDGTLYRINSNSVLPAWAFQTNPDTSSQDDPSVWAVEEVEAAREAGLIPEAIDSAYQSDITREEFCQLAKKLLETKTGEGVLEIIDQKDLSMQNPFSDTSEQSVIAMNALGIVNGTGNGNFSPEENITREEAATMLTRLAKSMNRPGPSEISLSFADLNSISDWAYYSVGFVSECKDETQDKYVMGGTGNNEFSPQEQYTREQAIASFYRLFQAIEACSVQELYVEKEHNKADLEVVSFQGYHNHAVPTLDDHGALAIKIPEGASSAHDGIFVLENGSRLDTEEYEVWLRPFEGQTMPAEIEDENQILATQTGRAILTVQSKVTGEIWDVFDLLVVADGWKLMLDTAVPVQSVSSVLYGEQYLNFYNCGMYVEDYQMEIIDHGKTHHITMTVYNTTAIDGAIDIYDKDGQYLGSQRIEQHDILPSSPWEAVTDVFKLGYDLGSGDALTYRQSTESTETKIDLEVPAGGLLVLSNNFTTSPGAFSYNLSSLILNSAKIAEDLIDLTDNEKIEVKDTIATVIQESLKKINDSTQIQNIIKNGVQEVTKNLTIPCGEQDVNMLVSSSIEVLAEFGLNWNQLANDVIQDISKWVTGLAPNTFLDIIEQEGGPAGTALNIMFTVSNMAEMIPTFAHLKNSVDCSSVYIFVRDDMPWN